MAEPQKKDASFPPTSQTAPVISEPAKSEPAKPAKQETNAKPSKSDTAKPVKSE
ncbi:hypothetical protein MCHI_001842 [Candidatus Magnetoovum chiemensis]|nr:hypothetical protein MCHI_001842 [Candidatus Magnetoovum chiemensis]